MLEKMYLVGSSDARSERCVVRRQDNSDAGAISKDTMGWRVEDSPKEYPIVFTARVDATDFIFMRGRFIQFVLDHPSEKIEISVAPNFGQWLNCKVGLWVASIYWTDGEYAGRNSWAPSIREAKIAGLRRASNGYFAEYELELMTADDWPVRIVRAPKSEALTV
jgi:hypothetical protein